MSVLAAERQLLRCVRVLEECGVVDPDAGILGEFPEPEGGVQIQLPTLLLLASPKILLKHEWRSKLTNNRTQYSGFVCENLKKLGYVKKKKELL